MLDTPASRAHPALRCAPVAIALGLSLLAGAAPLARAAPDADQPDSKEIQDASKLGPAGLIGEPIVDISGHRHIVGGQAGSEPVVFLFMGHECPISNRAVPRLNAIAAIAREHRVQLFGVYSDATLARPTAVKHGREFAITFPRVLDCDGRLARALGPKVVPEAIVLDRAGAVAYRGAINDAFLELARPRARIHKRFLVEAIKAVAANQLPKVREKAAVGCFLETAPDPDPDTVSLRRHARPILQARCESCHLGDKTSDETRDKTDPFHSEATLTKHRAVLARVAREGHKTTVQSGLGRTARGPILSPVERRLLSAWAAGEGRLGPASEAPPMLSPTTAVRADRQSTLKRDQESTMVRFEAAAELVAIGVQPDPSSGKAAAGCSSFALELTLQLPGQPALALGQIQRHRPLALPAGLALRISEDATLTLRRVAPEGGPALTLHLQLATAAESRRPLIARRSSKSRRPAHCHGIALGPGQVLPRRGRAAAELGPTRRLFTAAALPVGGLLAADSELPATLFVAARHDEATPKTPPEVSPKRRRVF